MTVLDRFYCIAIQVYSVNEEVWIPFKHNFDKSADLDLLRLQRVYNGAELAMGQHEE